MKPIVQTRISPLLSPSSTPSSNWNASVSVSAPSIWSSLSLNCRSSSSVYTVNQMLKPELFSAAYGHAFPTYHRHLAPLIRQLPTARYNDVLID